MALRHVRIPQCVNVAWRLTAADPDTGGSFNYSAPTHPTRASTPRLRCSASTELKPSFD